jgi:hypothetical protein
MIEAKNAELKQAHGLEKADSVGDKNTRKPPLTASFVEV